MSRKYLLDCTASGAKWADDVQSSGARSMISSWCISSPGNLSRMALPSVSTAHSEESS